MILFSLLRTRKGALVALLGGIAAALGFVLYAAFAPRLVTDADRAEALGSFKDSPAEIRRAFSHLEDFERIPAPGPDDWLATHTENGQTYEAFLRGGFNRPDKTRRKLYFQPFDLAVNDKPAYLRSIKKFSELFFGLETVILPELSLKSVPVTSRINRYTGKRQLLATDIQEALKKNIPEDAFCVLGITMEDLYPGPSWNYISGYASFRDRVGVYSFFRYSADFLKEKETPAFRKGFLLRSQKVLAHEILHMFGLQHCIFYKCLENGINRTEEMDSRPLLLCPVCLRKLQYGSGFDIASRYAALESFYRAEGAAAEAAWIAARLAKIRR
jgi:archaemetzincin